MAKSSKKDTFVLLYESTYEMLKNRLRKCIIFSDVYIDVKLLKKKKTIFLRVIRVGILKTFEVLLNFLIWLVVREVFSL